MKATDLLKFAITGLKRRAARTFLTVLGVIIGTVCIVLMLSIGISNYEQSQMSNYSNTDLRKITLSHYDSGGSNDTNSGIKDSTITSIAAMKNVEAVSPVITISAILHAGKYQYNSQFKAVDPAVLDLDFAQGGMFPASSTMPYFIISGNTLGYFNDPENPRSDESWEDSEKFVPDIDLLTTPVDMKLGYYWEAPEYDAEAKISQQYRAGISGVTKKSFSNNSYDSYISLDSAKKLIMENRELAQDFGLNTNSYNEAVILVNDMENVTSVLEEVRKLGFQTFSPTENIKAAQEDNARQQGQLFAIGFISLFVSAIGIANTMYANILERRRDIGVMKVLGMKISKIRMLFMLESALIGLLGGIIGLIASFIVVLIINTGSGMESFMGMQFYGGMQVEIPAWLALAAMGIAIGVGVLSGIYPAHKATKMSALEAMKSS